MIVQFALDDDDRMFPGLDNSWFGHREYVTWDVYDLVKDRKSRTSVTPKTITMKFILPNCHRDLEQNYLL